MYADSFIGNKIFHFPTFNRIARLVGFYVALPQKAAAPDHFPGQATTSALDEAQDLSALSQFRGASNSNDGLFRIEVVALLCPST